uniref:Uncharacterized protein n=1 Tax=Macaca fascicularis TaxID=9541 RepID=A0A7N9IAZ0_MACFA
CWKFWLGLSSPQRFVRGLTLCVVHSMDSRVHVHNVQVCYICILVPCIITGPIN